MADARLKAVVNELTDLHTEPDYGVDLACTDMSNDVGLGDTLEIPDIAALTVIADGDTDTSGQTVTPVVSTLSVNLNPWINARLPQRQATQVLSGNWAPEVARTGFTNLRTSQDSNLFEHLIDQAWQTGTSVDYHTNVAGDTLTNADALNAMSRITDLQGVTESDLVWFMSSYGAASFRSISSFQPNFQAAERGDLGIPQIGTMNGVPVYQSSQVPRARTLASTAYDITTNVLTITVAAGHGLAAGQKVTFDTVTAGGDMTTSTAITSVTATVLTIAHTASNSSATEAGTVTVESSDNLLIARNHCYCAKQLMPISRIVPDPDSSGDMLQISTIWGRFARPGYAQVVHSPKASI